MVAELVFNLASYATLALVLVHIGATDILLFGFAAPMLMLALVFNPISRGYEHYPLAHLPPTDARRQDLRHNTITVTSRVVGWLWANINYHVEHHMYPRVPFYRLAQLHQLFDHAKYLTAPMPLSNLAGHAQLARASHLSSQKNQSL